MKRKHPTRHDYLIAKCAMKDSIKILADDDEAWVYDVEVPLFSIRESKIFWADMVIQAGSKDIIVEAKPTLDDVGEAVRQIKRYKMLWKEQSKENLTRQISRCVIATFDDVPEIFVEMLKHEGIEVVVLEDDVTPSRVMVARSPKEWAAL